MPYTPFEVKKYRISLSYGAKKRIAAIGKAVRLRGVINCFGEHNHEDYCLRLLFLASGKAPRPYYDVEEKTGGIFLPFNEMPIFVDLLRNEKPVYAYLHTEPKLNAIGTITEPVGEGEIAPP